ncbi:hypothetical protein O6H91_14G040600 [Diphasiastrum complanatum]|uniref:Uncharacterized protein n=1 Tax=Diphasiastrum complanatum TaxID=34168 RepID=A0ACC2BNI0_DIPCM|nr:hypothetical protein O6H91_14G040600 [Diphasiastrum complanatum]
MLMMHEVVEKTNGTADCLLVRLNFSLLSGCVLSEKVGRNESLSGTILCAADSSA